LEPPPYVEEEEEWIHHPSSSLVDLLEQCPKTSSMVEVELKVDYCRCA